MVVLPPILLNPKSLVKKVAYLVPIFFENNPQNFSQGISVKIVLF
jgi:hypothetical protein